MKNEVTTENEKKIIIIIVLLIEIGLFAYVSLTNIWKIACDSVIDNLFIQKMKCLPKMMCVM